jgi:hypothetical protein
VEIGAGHSGGDEVFFAERTPNWIAVIYIYHPEMDRD